MRLQHLHLPSLIPYLHASHLQSLLIHPHLTHKALSPTLRLTTPLPTPTLLTFQTPPTYTCGRREIPTITAAQIAHLRANNAAEFHPALRGGQTTFHGPGQLTAYLVLTLAAHGLSPRTYVRFLETAVVETCAAYGVRAHTTENPGVWVTEDEKIASVGVHLRRGVASHGVSLNVSTELGWFERIVACGLVGKRTTSLEREGVTGVEVAEVAEVFAGLVEKGLEGVEGMVFINEEEVLAMETGEGQGMGKGEG